MGYHYPARRQNYTTPLRQDDAEIEHPLSTPPQPLRALGLEHASQSEQLGIVEE